MHLAMTTSDPANTSDFASDTERWAAVARRDRGADGKFYYAVRPPACTAGPRARRDLPAARTSVFTNLHTRPNRPVSDRVGVAIRTSPRLPNSAPMPSRKPAARSKPPNAYRRSTHLRKPPA